ncbi:hypothetical protein SDC9_199221 [bioreactor metagenome]|uniref:Uncharacterized protein n=1 Tax=bioreactor metagenome TaxID=1076179 RepID=A0A645IWK6_9ZZZZ
MLHAVPSVVSRIGFSDSVPSTINEKKAQSQELVSWACWVWQLHARTQRVVSDLLRRLLVTQGHKVRACQCSDVGFSLDAIPTIVAPGTAVEVRRKIWGVDAIGFVVEENDLWFSVELRFQDHIGAMFLLNAGHQRRISE